ncbi:MAG: LysM peptidoglycan-binding domain-containing protein [Opitutales bacterium]|nr:LysM peptidoglycan-binding domain-containing protein [Opitutales bacterium]
MKVFSIVSSIVFLHIVAFVLLVNGCSTRSHRTNHYRATHPNVQVAGEPTSSRPFEPTESEVVTGDPITLDEPALAEEQPIHPVPPPPATNDVKPDANNGNEKVYVVVRGDSLWSIAKNNGTTINALCERNNISRNTTLREGRKLVIPPKTEKKDGASAENAAKATDPNAKVYVVKAGDALSKIAQAHGVTTKELMAANNIKNANNIRIGQKLTIPSKEAPKTTEQRCGTGEKKAAAPQQDVPEPEKSVPEQKPVQEKETAPVQQEELAPVTETVSAEPSEAVVE